MRRIVSSVLGILLLLGVVLGLTGCGGDDNYVFVSLKGNALAGYTWVCTTEDLGCVELLSQEYLDGDTLCTVGKSGAFVFNYGPVSPGSVDLEYEYVREWEDKEPVMTAKYRLTVDEDGIISYEILEAPDYGDDDDMY